MESDHEELYLQKLKSYVLDEDKVVTCPWLSKTLELDLNSSRDLLKTFLKDSVSLKTNLVVTYVLKGILLEDDLKGVCIVKQDDLEEKKKLFKEVDESVYSVQKGDNVDFNIIGMVDMLDINNPREKPMAGSIIGKNCVKRKLKAKKALPVVNRAAPTDKSKASHLFSNTKNNKTEMKNSTNGTGKPDEDAKKKETNNVKPPVKNQKGSIASMFSNMPKVKPEAKSPETKSESPKGDVKNGVKMEVDDDEDTEVEEEVKMIGDKKNGFYDSGTDEEARKIEERNKSTSEGNKKRKSVKRARKADKSSERPQKKRKRIIPKDDSDSDDIFADADEDNDFQEQKAAVVVSDDETVYKKTTPPEPRKGKKRTYVDKTYMDEEGYMVTKKEWVYETASEDENEENKEANKKVEVKRAKPVEEAEKTKKEVSPTKGMKGKSNKAKPANQPTLMSFFKKK